MKLKLTFALLLAICSATFAAQEKPRPIEACSTELPYGVPSSSKERTMKLCRTAYAVEYDLSAKIPVWVGYVLTPQEAIGCFARTNAFAPDYSIPAESRAVLKDYRRSGYDTGHMANDSDMRWSKQAEEESFLLTNMTPQLPGFNRGIWKKLEDSTRGWALSRQHPLLVYAGAIYGPDDAVIGNGVKVPRAFFKVLVDIVTGESQAFLFKHAATTDSLDSFLSTPEQVQAASGVKLPLPAIKSSERMWRRDMKSNKKAKAAACTLS